MESGTAAAAGAAAAALSTLAAAGLTASTHEQQAEEETEKQAAEREAQAIKRQLDAACWQRAACTLLEDLGACARANGWQVEVHAEVHHGGDGICGELFNSKNTAPRIFKSPKDHYT